jgi:hypothetical protein
MLTTSMSLPSKAGLKNNKHGLNDRGSNVGKPASQVCFLSLRHCVKLKVPVGKDATSINKMPVFETVKIH